VNRNLALAALIVPAVAAAEIFELHLFRNLENKRLDSFVKQLAGRFAASVRK
jgi:hypothetical protein